MNPQAHLENVKEAAVYLVDKLPSPDVAIVLGSGLGRATSILSSAIEISYTKIPNFPNTTVAGHTGKLIAGEFSGKNIYIFSGRFHYYEGYEPEIVVLPMRVLHMLGCPTVILTNASGGINLDFTPGDLMLITDHINMTGYNPLRGRNFDELGPRFPDMTMAYTPELCDLAKNTAAELGISLQQGVYCGLAGPNFETPAEIRMLRLLGVDAVGMSTVPEVLAANHMGMKILGISCISNMAAGVSTKPLSHEEVFVTTKDVEKTFINLLIGIIKNLKP